MKASLILLAALILNTTLLIAEPLSVMVRSLQPWILVLLEGILFIGCFLKKWMEGFNRMMFKGISKKASLFRDADEDKK